jgi:malate dehydrogenase (quinone)
MLDLLARCFPEQYPQWLPTIKTLVPTVGTKLSDSPDRAKEVMESTATVLGLTL